MPNKKSRCLRPGGMGLFGLVLIVGLALPTRAEDAAVLSLSDIKRSLYIIRRDIESGRKVESDGFEVTESELRNFEKFGLRVGDRIKEFRVEQGFKLGNELDPINELHLLIVRSGKEQHINLPFKNLRVESRVVRELSQSLDEIAESPHVSYRDTGQGSATVEVERSFLDESLSNLPLLLTSARGVPYFKDGKSIGVRLFAMRRGTFFERIGLLNGDIVLSLNGAPLDTMTQFHELLGKSPKGEFLLELERNRSPFKITVKVVDDKRADKAPSRDEMRKAFKAAIKRAEDAEKK